MVILFGDSWARQSWMHASENTSNGYQHWSLPNTWVVNTEDWFNSFFTQNLVVNFARFGNTTDWIMRDLFHGLNTVTNLPDRVDFVVFQTDPLRIFAPRQDYTQQHIVWPNFITWCDRSAFKWQTQDLEDLLSTIYLDWYQDLNAFQYTAQNLNPGKQMYLWLVGGVSKLHPVIGRFRHRIITDSITGFFGFDNDCCLENRASLANLIGFWTDHLQDHSQRHLLREQWRRLDDILRDKEDFWVQHPENFAGRHLTSKAMRKLAEHIEQSLLRSMPK